MIIHYVLGQVAQTRELMQLPRMFTRVCLAAIEYENNKEE